MISLVNMPAPASATVKGAATGASAGAASGDDFVLSLAAFLDAIQPAVADGTGQVDAGPGKELPASEPVDEPATLDLALLPTPPLPVFAWQVPVEPVMTAAAAPLMAGVAAAPALPVPANDAAPVAASPALAALLKSAIADEPTPPVATMTIEPLPTKQPVDPEKPVPTTIVLAPAAPVPLVAGTTAPAQQMFAAAIHAATSEIAPDRPVGDGAADPLAQPVAMQTQTPAIAAPATAAAQDTPLDMRHERWPHAMIDHIEGLRDAADAISTRIRLVPDALGGIDVSVRRDGDTVHVRFQADQAATRTILTDAQPKLAEIAEQRGIRLGDTSVAGGGAGGMAGGEQQQRSAQPFTPPLPAAPASAATPAPETDADIRIA